jgi:hypothetical protein
MCYFAFKLLKKVTDVHETNERFPSKGLPNLLIFPPFKNNNKNNNSINNNNNNNNTLL